MEKRMLLNQRWYLLHMSVSVHLNLWHVYFVYLLFHFYFSMFLVFSCFCRLLHPYTVRSLYCVAR